MEPGGPRSPKEVVQEVAQGVKEVVLSEVHLAKIEMRERARSYGIQGAKLGAAGGLLFFGSFSLLAFLVIGFGGILGGNYWLSAAIVGAILCAAGGILLRASLSGLKREEPVLPHLQRSIESQKATIQEKLAKVTDITTRRRPDP